MKKQKILATIIALSIVLVSFSCLHTVKAQTSGMLSLPAYAYSHHQPYALRTESFAGTQLLSVSQQTVNVQSGQSVSIDISYRVYSSSNLGAIMQLFFAESWTPSWPANGYTIAVYNGQPGNGVTETKKITFNAPTAAGTYYLWFCWDSQYNMQNAVNLFSASMNGLPAHIKVVVAGPTPTPTPTPASGLLGYWKFDEGSGGIAKDSSGKGNSGVIQGATWTNGKFEKGLSFSTTSNSVYVQSSASLEAPSSISVMAWVKLDGLTGTFQVICTRWYGQSGEESTKCFVLEFQPDGLAPWFKVRNAVGMEAWATSNANVALGQWTHIAGTYDGTNIKIYIDGSLTGTVPFSGQLNPTTAPLKIGGSTGHGDRFSGTLDEVKIYDYALTEEQIRSNMNTTPTPTPTPTPAPTQQMDQWLIFGIIGTGIIVAVVLAVFAISRRKRAPTPKETNVSPQKPIPKEQQVCPNCGAILPPGSKFCGKCGTPLQ